MLFIDIPISSELGVKNYHSFIKFNGHYTHKNIHNFSYFIVILNIINKCNNCSFSLYSKKETTLAIKILLFFVLHFQIIHRRHWGTQFCDCFSGIKVCRSG